MRFRTTLIWLAIAASLFAFIFFYERHARIRDEAPAGSVFPRIDPGSVDMIQVRPGHDLEIRAVHTNDAWQIEEPLEWPAQTATLDKFLSTLATLQPAAYITPADIRSRPSAEHEYGFDAPRASIIVRQGARRVHMLVGGMTAPGDQFFLQVVGLEGVFVFGADALKIIPASINDWRDTSLVDLNKTRVDSVSVTNSAKSFSLQRDASRIWRLVYPIKARADQARVHDALERTHSLRATKFVTDDPNPDFESYGLKPAALYISLSQGTNPPMDLLFGRSPTNHAGHVFATRRGWKAVVAVEKQFVEAWEQPVDSFRDPFLLSTTAPVQSVSVSGKETFTLEWQAAGGWRVAPSNWPGDADLAKEFIARLNGLKVVQFVKDVVTEPDLPPYGLNKPSATIKVRMAAEAGATNTNQVELQFGIEQDGKVFARRTDEASIYALGTNDVRQLPTAPWQLRERKLWNFAPDDVKRVTTRNGGRVRELLRRGPQSWELGQGSQGVINDLAVDETVRGLSGAAVDRWVALGAGERAKFGIRDGGFELSIELTDGRSVKVEFGQMTETQGAYAAVTLDGMVWIGEFPWILCRDVASHLGPPAATTK